MAHHAAGASCSSARRRRERRMRMHLRHERFSVAMALAAALHHSSDGVRGTYSGLRAQTTARARPEPAELFELYSEDGRPGGLRPPPLSEVRPQDGVMRHAERDLEHALPQLQVLDVPVPPVERTQQFYFLMLHDAGKRAAVLWAAGGGHGRASARTSWSAPTELRCSYLRLLNEFVDEPTFGVQEQAIVQSLPDAQVHVPLRRVQQQTVAQVVDVHVPHSALSGIVEQMVDVPEPGRISSDVSERNVEQMVDFPVPGRISSEVTERIVEQVVDVPVFRGAPLHLANQQITDSSAAALDTSEEPFQRVFRTFPRRKKSATTRRESSAPLGCALQLVDGAALWRRGLLGWALRAMSTVLRPRVPAVLLVSERL